MDNMDRDDLFGMFGDMDWNENSFNDFLREKKPMSDEEFLDVSNRNSFKLLTGTMCMDDITEGMGVVHNPFKRDPKEIEAIMQYFIETEEYEKCAVLRDMLAKDSGEFLEDTPESTASEPPRE
jgi:hypothetical protein